MEELDQVFCRADFSAGREGLEGRIWEKIADSIKTLEMEEQELTDEELFYVTAAGSPHVLRKKEES